MNDQEAKRKEALKALDYVRAHIFGKDITKSCADTALGKCDELEAALTQSANVVPEWLPIETAPRDGTKIQLICKHKTRSGITVWKPVAAWTRNTHSISKNEDWRDCYTNWNEDMTDLEPIKWKPLPQALTKESE